jgi:hypothetical protein
MLSCQRAGELISRALDTKLSLRQRLALTVHLCACHWCRRFRRQLWLVEQACRAWGRSDRTIETNGDVFLSEEARQRIRRALQRANSTDPE